MAKTFLEFLTESESLAEAKQPVAKEKVEKLLIKRGWNPKDAKKLVDSDFDSVVKSYPDATTAGKIADIIIVS